MIEDTIKQETENYEVKIGNKKWIVPAGAAIATALPKYK